MAEDWNYAMRREMQEIIPGLYLGPYSCATKSKFHILLEHGITHVICIRQTVEAHIIKPHFPDKFKYLVIEMYDTYTQNLISHLAECRHFIDESFASGGKCLVHGNLGVSRSAAIVIGYIMEKKSMSYKEAFELVQSRRYCANPNDSFKRQLIEYEAIYKAQRILLNGQCSQAKASLKRKYEQSSDAGIDVCEEMEEIS